MAHLTESVVEQAALAWLESLGWRVTHGLEIAPGEAEAERSDPNYRDVVREGVFEDRGCRRRYCWAGGTTEHE